MNKYIVFAIVLCLVSCNIRSKVDYNEATEKDHNFYIELYNNNVNSSMKVDNIYKDFGGYNNDIRIFWFKNLKESGLEQARYDLKYKDITFVFENGDMIYLYCKENVYNHFFTQFSYAFYRYLSDDEIKDFYKKYIKFVDDERKSGRI